MPKNSKKRDPIAKHFKSIDEAAAFWDSHDLTDYWDLTREAQFEVDIKTACVSNSVGTGIGKKISRLCA